MKAKNVTAAGQGTGTAQHPLIVFFGAPESFVGPLQAAFRNRPFHLIAARGAEQTQTLMRHPKLAVAIVFDHSLADPISLIEEVRDSSSAQSCSKWILVSRDQSPSFKAKAKGRARIDRIFGYPLVSEQLLLAVNELATQASRQLGLEQKTREQLPSTAPLGVAASALLSPHTVSPNIGAPQNSKTAEVNGISAKINAAMSDVKAIKDVASNIVKLENRNKLPTGDRSGVVPSTLKIFRERGLALAIGLETLPEASDFRTRRDWLAFSEDLYQKSSVSSQNLENLLQ